MPDAHPILHRALPFLKWMTGYRGADLSRDAVAGLTVAVILIPQAMAYALLAGMPPVYGLYAATLAPAIGGLWGSLRQLATGPIAVMSLLVLTTLGPLAEPGTPVYIERALVLSLLVGGIYLLVGLLRLGIVMTFVSHAAVKGFTSAAALIIIATQLPNLFGVPAGHHEYIHGMLLNLAVSLKSIHWPTAMTGLSAFALIYSIKRAKPRFPAGLLAIAITAGIVYRFGLQETGIAVIGEVPGGLPVFHVPQVPIGVYADLLGPAVVIALVSFAETYSISKSISARTKQSVHTDQEFIGQGLANLVGGFLQCYPVSGSLSRTAVNYEAGARSAIASVITSLTVMLTLLFLTPLLAYIPKATLSALVIGAVLLLFNPREVFHLWRLNRDDGIVAVTVFSLSLLLKPDYALLIGVSMSLIFFLWKTMHPRIVTMTRDPLTKKFVNAERAGKRECPQLLHLRIDNELYFGNAEYTVEQILEKADGQRPGVKFVLLDFHGVAFMDLTAADELAYLKEELADRGIGLAVMGLNRPVRKLLDRTGFLSEKPIVQIDGHKGEAVARLFKDLDHDHCRQVCPLYLFDECRIVK